MGKAFSFQQGPGSQRRRRIFFAVSGVLFLLIVFVFREVLAPFVLAVIVAFVLAPVVDRVQRVRAGRLKPPRWIAVLSVYMLLLASLASLLAFAVPRLVVEIQRFGREAPRTVERIRDEYMPRMQASLERNFGTHIDRDAETAAAAHAPGEDEHTSIRIVPGTDGGYEVILPSRGLEVTPSRDGGYRVRTAPAAAENQAHRNGMSIVTDMFSRAMQNGEQHAITLLQTIQNLIRALIKGIFTLSMTLMLSAYLLITSDRIFAFFRSMVRYDQTHQFDDLLRRIDRGLAGVVRGQLLICLVNGALSAVGFYLLHLPYWPILTLLATVFSIIPIFGAFISSVPAVLLGFQVGIWTPVFVLVWIIGIHQIEANVLNPKIMGDSAKVHPVLVIFALLAGEHIFGLTGALLAVPTLSVAQSLFLHFRMLSLGLPSSTTAIPPPMTDPGAAGPYSEPPPSRPPSRSTE
ncbi:MAG: AI-2E family transporter [Sandaracinaceae bacterium]|jgi:predicted PurR-regulated permease PerM|nr:AI-2E family transporter [Sandaracinaceae bacterium]